MNAVGKAPAPVHGLLSPRIIPSTLPHIPQALFQHLKAHGFAGVEASLTDLGTWDAARSCVMHKFSTHNSTHTTQIQRRHAGGAAGVRTDPGGRRAGAGCRRLLELAGRSVELMVYCFHSKTRFPAQIQQTYEPTTQPTDRPTNNHRTMRAPPPGTTTSPLLCTWPSWRSSYARSDRRVMTLACGGVRGNGPHFPSSTSIVHRLWTSAPCT